MNKYQLTCQIDDKIILKTAYKLLEQYAGQTNEKLKSFVRKKISSGDISASQIKDEYTQMSNIPEWIYMFCGDICYHEYILPEARKERIMEIISLSNAFPQLKNTCSMVIKVKDSKDEELFKRQSYKSYKDFMSIPGSASEKISLYCLYMWANDVYSPFVSHLFHTINMTYYQNLDDRIIMNCKRLKIPFENNDEVQFLFRKAVKKLERISGKTKDEMIEDIVKEFYEKHSINTLEFQEEFFDFVPLWNNGKVQDTIREIFDEKIMDYIRTAYINVINAQQQADNENQLKIDLAMPKELAITTSGISFPDSIIKYKGIETFIDDDVYDKTKVQRALSEIDYQRFKINVMLAVYFDEIKKTYRQGVKKIFLDTLMGNDSDTLVRKGEENRKIKEQEDIIKTQQNDINKLNQALQRAEDNRLQQKYDACVEQVIEKDRIIQKREKEIDKLQDNEMQYNIKIALLEEEVKRLKKPRTTKENTIIDSNARYSFVCINESLSSKLIKWFPNSSIFTHNKDINANSIDAVIMMTGHISHHVYYDAKTLALRRNIPIVHCPVQNYEGICGYIGDVLYE